MEIINRLAALRNLIRDSGCTHGLITDPLDAHQISGFKSSNVYLLVSSRRQILFTDFRYREVAGRFVRLHPEWKFVEVKSTAFKTIAAHVPVGARVGYQSNLLPVDTMARLRAALKGSKLVRFGEKIAWLTVPKTASEVKAMAHAARIGDRALERVRAQLRLGISEAEIAGLLEEQCHLLGSKGPAFETIVLFGRRSALPHGVPGTTPLRKGDFILFDFGCTVDTFFSDMTRTFVAGKASSGQKQVYESVRLSQEAGRRAIRAGMRCCDVDRVVRCLIEQDGFGDAFGHATGHGVGCRIHENPRLASSEKSVLPPCAVVTVEPGIYLPELGGVRIEDMVFLHPEKPRVLTSFPRHLMELEL